MTVTRSAKERLPRLYHWSTHHVGANHTRCIFVQSQRNWRRVYTKFAKPKIVSPTAIAKLAIDSDRLECLVINREICIPNRDIGRFSLFYQKSGDLPQNRETWKLWCRLVKTSVGTIHRCIAILVTQFARIAILNKKICFWFVCSLDTSRHWDSIPVIVFLACDFRGPGTNLIGSKKRSHFPTHDQSPGAVQGPDSIHSSQHIYMLCVYCCLAQRKETMVQHLSQTEGGSCIIMKQIFQ